MVKDEMSGEERDILDRFERGESYAQSRMLSVRCIWLARQPATPSTRPSG